MSAYFPAVLLLALLSAPPASAQSTQSGITDTVATGVKVTVVDDRGVMTEGRVEGVSEQAVRLAVRGGSKEIPVDHIVRIERPDSIENGVLVGLGVGVALGTMAGITAVANGGTGAEFVVGSIVGNSLVCAGIGALIDAAIDGRKTLYERGKRTDTRVTPVFDKGLRGVAVSVSW